jgi:hypothetical protein
MEVSRLENLVFIKNVKLNDENDTSFIQNSQTLMAFLCIFPGDILTKTKKHMK